MSAEELRSETPVPPFRNMEVNFDYYSAFVADEPAISHAVENLVRRNHATEYFILLGMCYKGATSLIKYVMMSQALGYTVTLKS